MEQQNFKKENFCGLCIVAMELMNALMMQLLEFSYAFTIFDITKLSSLKSFLSIRNGHKTVVVLVTNKDVVYFLIPSCTYTCMYICMCTLEVKTPS